MFTYQACVGSEGVDRLVKRLCGRFIFPWSQRGVCFQSRLLKTIGTSVLLDFFPSNSSVLHSGRLARGLVRCETSLIMANSS